MSLGQIPASVKEAVHIKMEAPLFFFVPQKLLESSTEIAPSRGSFMKKERLGKGFTFLLHTSVGASVLDAQRCGSSRSKRSTHVFKCKAPGLFQKLVESSTETAPSSGSSMEKVPLSKGLGNFHWTPHTLDTLKQKLRVFFRVIFSSWKLHMFVVVNVHFMVCF